MQTTRKSLINALMTDRHDQRAWREFDRVYRGILARYASARGLSGSDADDVVQESMLAISKYLKSYDRQKGRFRAWLRTMVNRKVWDFNGRVQLEELRSREALNQADDKIVKDDLFDEIFDQGHLEYAIEILKSETNERRFAAFNLYCLADGTASEVATLLKMDKDELYSIKFALTRRLGKILRELLDGDEAGV
ncbi:MAG: RNA polymerase sigma factor [Planctomycetota bacterium]|jgi:RNA polymerase sigma-70 factor (ECF subfamily)